MPLIGTQIWRHLAFHSSARAKLADRESVAVFDVLEQGQENTSDLVHTISQVPDLHTRLKISVKLLYI